MNPAKAIALADGAVVIPDRATFETLSVSQTGGRCATDRAPTTRTCRGSTGRRGRQLRPGLERLGAWRDPVAGRWVAPSDSTRCRVLAIVFHRGFHPLREAHLHFMMQRQDTLDAILPPA